MTAIFWAPADSSTTSNSVFSSAGAAAAAGPATATAAAAETPHASSRAFTRSLISRTVLPDSSLMISSFVIFCFLFYLSTNAVFHALETV